MKKQMLIGTSPRHWFLRGMLVGPLSIAALNALSYFARPDSWDA